MALASAVCALDGGLRTGEASPGACSCEMCNPPALLQSSSAKQRRKQGLPDGTDRREICEENCSWLANRKVEEHPLNISLAFAFFRAHFSPLPSPVFNPTSKAPTLGCPVRRLSTLMPLSPVELISSVFIIVVDNFCPLRGLFCLK